MSQKKIEQRVLVVANTVLYEKMHVSSIDILLGLGWLMPSHVRDWREGKIRYLEQAISANLSKVSFSMECFRRWAAKEGLVPCEAKYILKTCCQSRDLQFSKSGDLGIEKHYRTHYLSPALGSKKCKTTREKLNKKPELVMFQVINATKCDQCRQDIHSGSLLLKEEGKALCIKCTNMDHLVWLPRGNAKLTRQVKAKCSLFVVIVRWSTKRKIYERQGLLVEKEVLKEVCASLGIVENVI